jgi:hypothetical protein
MIKFTLRGKQSSEKTMLARSFRPLGLAAAAALAFAGSVAAAGSLPKPVGAPILTVSGNIANTNEGNVAQLDQAMLEAIGMVKFTSRTPWYEQPVEFEGVPMKALMAYVGAEGTEVTVTALNDYQSTVPMEDFEQFDSILAIKKDGETMPVRDKGPLWLVYPYDTDSELNTDKYFSRSVWQIKAMTVQ